MGGPFQTIKVEKQGSSATVTLARPDARNALNGPAVAELTGAFEDLARDNSLRAVVLVGDGPSFCAGADIGWMRDAGGLTQAENEEDARRLAKMFLAWSDIPCPTLALAHGAALGGGTGLLAAADIAIAEQGCKLGFTEVRLGLIPAVISRVVIPAIGAHHARRYFVTGEIFDARRAAEIGLVSEVVADGEGRARLEVLRRLVTSAGPLAVREAKALVRRYRGAPESWPKSPDLAQTIARLRASPEASEGLTAFLEKRDPSWKAGAEPVFKRVLVANRGEIASRIIRTLKVMGIEAVAVFSEADRDAPFVREASVAVAIGASDAASSYLNSEVILAAAKATRSDAIHPGYGFLSESAAFALQCSAAGTKFIGPSPASIEQLGNKKRARQLAESVGVAVVPGGEIGSDNRASRAFAKKLGFPILIKAAGGGGGKGMRRVDRVDDLDEAIASARRESKAAFGSDALILERLLEGARHVEVQIVGDASGRVVSILERDCSLQRRHQKVVEECPCPRVDGGVRAKLLADAARLATAGKYENAGTLEFLLTDTGEVFFLEMNTRLQVEHPVTELVCGLDLVAWQIRIASGHRFSDQPPAVEARGHAIEARIYAEDPAAGFLPQTGRLERVRWPRGPGIRVDAGVESGSLMTPHYDPMMGKVIAWGSDREEARSRLVQALRETLLVGLRTNAPFLISTLSSGRFRTGDYDTSSVEKGAFELGPAPDPPEDVLVLAAVALEKKPDVPSTPHVPTAAGPWDASDSFRIVGGGDRD